MSDRLAGREPCSAYVRHIAFVLFAAVLTACSGSDWNATRLPDGFLRLEDAIAEDVRRLVEASA